MEASHASERRIISRIDIPNRVVVELDLLPIVYIDRDITDFLLFARSNARGAIAVEIEPLLKRNPLIRAQISHACLSLVFPAHHLVQDEGISP